MVTQAPVYIPGTPARAKASFGSPTPSSDAKGSASNMTGVDLLGLSHEEVNAMDAWWHIRGSEG